MITEDYVSLETAKLLKERGFKEWCFHCYGVAVLHNGVDISFDEECELKDEGRENEIEYIEGGRFYDYGCNNSDKDTKVWSAPSLQVAIKWLRKEKGVDILFDVSAWRTYDWYYVFEGNKYHYEEMSFEYSNPEDAADDAIKYCLEHIDKLNEK